MNDIYMMFSNKASMNVPDGIFSLIKIIIKIKINNLHNFVFYL